MTPLSAAAAVRDAGGGDHDAAGRLRQVDQGLPEAARGAGSAHLPGLLRARPAARDAGQGRDIVGGA